MKTIVFDLDGTLLNTLEDIAISCNTVLERRGWPVHKVEDYRYMVGNGFVTLIRRAVPVDVPMTRETLESVVADAREFYSGHLMVHTQPYPGMVEALRKLAEAEVAMSVLSNKPNDQSLVLIKHFFPDIPFVCIQGALPNVPLKPDPDGLLHILKVMGAQRRRCCYVGDSNVDMITARNAGVPGIGVAWGFRDVQELKNSCAERILYAPGDLTSLNREALY